ncbi:hypothetical protein [Natronincola ferrireducens]|uniref:Heat induced stress protein YflT n=1 Tax=Natronincola ferrireducens TaxID=393762 RepID=A0A1G9BB06_9FIRM|nr:hypothetical protein [Natronincola ferrireducens]SDK36691.1 hypothetical protein SAMN05660472_01125 [Natronincola ferrireducens]
MKIAGYFNSLKIANEAIEALHRVGFKNATLDLKDNTVGDGNYITNLPGTEMSTSLSNLILESGDRGIDIDKAPLSAANPMVSGMAGFDEIADYGHKIVVDADDEDEEEIKALITKFGGELNIPDM